VAHFLDNIFQAFYPDYNSSQRACLSFNISRPPQKGHLLSWTKCCDPQCCFEIAFLVVLYFCLWIIWVGGWVGGGDYIQEKMMTDAVIPSHNPNLMVLQ
jgi:hypothetical protein